MEAYIIINGIKIDAYRFQDIYDNKYHSTETPLKVSFGYENGYGKCDLEIEIAQEGLENKCIILNTTQYDDKKLFHKMPTTVVSFPKEFLNKQYVHLKASLRSPYN